MAKKPDGSTKVTGLRRQAEKGLRVTRHDVAAMPVNDVQQLVHELQVHQVELEVQNDELRRTQLQLEVARDRYVDLYDFSPTGHLTVDTHGKIVEANLRAGTLLGANRKELIGQLLARFVAVEYADIFHRHCQEVLKTGTRQACEVYLSKKIGGSRWVCFESLALHKESGLSTHWRTALLDISDRKLAERQLDAQRAALDKHATVAITDLRGRITFVNDKFCMISKYSREELLGQDHRIINSGYHPKKFIRDLWTTIAQGLVWQGEIKNRAKDGSFYWMDTTIVPFLDEEKKPHQYLAIHADITERKRVEDTLRESEERFRTMANTMPQLAWIARFDGHILWYNKRWYDYTGTTLEQMEGWGWESVHDTVELSKVKARWKKSIAASVPFEMSFPLRGADGNFRSFLTRVIPMKDEDGQVLQWFGTNTDVEELTRAEEALRAEVIVRKQAEAQVRVLNSELEERVTERVAELATKAQLLAEQNVQVEKARRVLEAQAAELALTSTYKSEFLANMSHELRTPLNSILIFSQQLIDNTTGNLTGKQIQFSRHINSSGTDLLHLIDDILDLSKIESGTVTVEVEEILFTGLSDIIDRNFRYMAESKGLLFDVQFEKGLPRAMDTDSTRVQQILKNFLSNAVKFTDRGHIEVRVCFAAQGWSLDHPVLSGVQKVIAFAVEDSGIGIAPEKQQLIFETFQQADAGTSRKYGGTGLGLAISRELAMLLGGEITLESVYGKGSTFTLYLPLHYAGPDNRGLAQGIVPSGTKAKSIILKDVQSSERLLDETDLFLHRGITDLPVEKQHMIERPHGSNEILRGRKILVVDDDARNIFALTSLLENQEMDVVSATNGRSAIDIIQHTPDLNMVLMDIMMPDMDGYETIREIRKAHEFRNLPILALTAKAMKGDREKCLDAGASDYIAKPVNTDQLLSLMQVWFLDERDHETRAPLYEQ